MMRTLLLLLISLIGVNLSAQDNPIIYAIPGQGADARLFKNISIEGYSIQPVHFTVPEEGMDMNAYAHMLSEQIDTTKPFILLGTSIGGMLATEMTTFLNPEKTIIIASAKCEAELPKTYTIQRKLGLYKWLSGKFYIASAHVAQPLVEPDRRKEKATYVSMLNDKHPDFMKRAIAMIVTWDRQEIPEGIIHIHGEKDNTLPIKNVTYDYLIEDGSHMMTLTRGEELSALIEEILKEEEVESF